MDLNMGWRGLFLGIFACACGGGEALTVEVEGACDAFTLTYETTSEFNVVGVRDAWGIVDAAASGEEIGLLIGVRTDRAAFARIGLDGSVVGEPLELDL